jgi:hypothetical protein
MTIFISGPITGHDNYKEPFQRAENEMLNRFPGATVLNPAEFCSDIPNGSPWCTYMERCLDTLEQATHIYMLDGWEESHGAWVEHREARKRGVILL